MEQPLSYDDYNQHIELLKEKGYLDSRFKTPTQLGNWIHDFAESFEIAKNQAHLRKAERKPGDTGPAVSAFMMPLRGRFNEGLTDIYFNFWYRYNSAAEKLSLFLLQAYKLAGDPNFPRRKIRKRYEITDPSKLILPEEVYASLRKPDLAKGNLPMHINLYRQFEHQRNPENDWQRDPRTEPYYDPQDPYEYDPEAEVDRFRTSKFDRKPQDHDFKPPAGIQFGVPPSSMLGDLPGTPKLNMKKRSQR